MIGYFKAGMAHFEISMWVEDAYHFKSKYDQSIDISTLYF